MFCFASAGCRRRAAASSARRRSSRSTHQRNTLAALGDVEKDAIAPDDRRRAGPLRQRAASRRCSRSWTSGPAGSSRALMPFSSGPRHCGQFSAASGSGLSRTTARSAMRGFLIEARCAPQAGFPEGVDPHFRWHTSTSAVHQSRSDSSTETLRPVSSA